VKASLGRALLAGVLGGIAMNAAMFLTFRLIGFGLQGEGVLLSSPLQSEKLVAVWTRLEPLPLVVERPLVIVSGLMLFAIFHAFAYREVAAALPAGFWPRCWRYALALWVSVFVFWEFFTPFNQFGEPLALLALEVVFWLVTALAEAAIVVWRIG
jgi:hypothetical protein